MWECPCVDCVLSSVFGTRADFDVDTSHIFPQGVLATVTLIGSMVGAGGCKTCAVCEAELSLPCSYPWPLRGGVCSPFAIAEVPSAGLKWSVPFQCVFCPKDRSTESSVLTEI